MTYLGFHKNRKTETRLATHQMCSVDVVASLLRLHHTLLPLTASAPSRTHSGSETMKTKCHGKESHLSVAMVTCRLTSGGRGGGGMSPCVRHIGNALFRHFFLFVTQFFLSVFFFFFSFFPSVLPSFLTPFFPSLSSFFALPSFLIL